MLQLHLIECKKIDMYTNVNDPGIINDDLYTKRVLVQTDSWPHLDGQPAWSERAEGSDAASSVEKHTGGASSWKRQSDGRLLLLGGDGCSRCLHLGSDSCEGVYLREQVLASIVLDQIKHRLDIVMV